MGVSASSPPIQQKIRNILNIRGTQVTDGGNITIQTINIPQLSTDQTLQIEIGLIRIAGANNASLSCGAVTKATAGATAVGNEGILFYGYNSALYQVGTTSSVSATNFYAAAGTLDLVINGNAGETFGYSCNINIIG